MFRCLRIGSNARRRTIVVGCVLGVVTGAGTALGSHVTGSPARDYRPTQARQELRIPTSWGATASVWSAPNLNAPGARCRFLQLDNPDARATTFRDQGGAQGCFGFLTSAQASENPIDWRLTWVLIPGGDYGVIVSGAATPGSGAVRVGLQAASGSGPFIASGRYFLGQLAVSSAPAVLPGTPSGSVNGQGTFTLVAYDALGTLVGRVDLNEVAAEALRHNPNP